MRYCCRDCQRADWADHKHECAALRAVTSAGENARADTLDADLLMARVRFARSRLRWLFVPVVSLLTVHVVCVSRQIWRRRMSHNPQARVQYAPSFAYSDIEEETHLQSHEAAFDSRLRGDTTAQLPFISSLCPGGALDAAQLGDVFGRCKGLLPSLIPTTSGR